MADASYSTQRFGDAAAQKARDFFELLGRTTRRQVAKIRGTDEVVAQFFEGAKPSVV